MTSSFAPKGMESKLVRLIDDGEYFGLRGAIAHALKFHGGKSTVEDLMILMNVFYSAASNMWVSGLIYKPLTPIFLFLAKRYGTQACKKEMPGFLDLNGTLLALNVRLYQRAPSCIDFGGIQVLQSCFARWLQMKEKLRLDTTYERGILHTCAGILAHPDVPRTLQALSAAIMMECLEIGTPEWLKKNNEVYDFYDMFSEEVTNGEADRGLAQTFVRLCRVLELPQQAQKVAAHYGLEDQRKKST